MTTEHGPPKPDTPATRGSASVEPDWMLGARGVEAGIDPGLLRLWHELGYVPTSDARSRFTADEVVCWQHGASPGAEQPIPDGGADLADLIELLSTDLEEAIEATLDQRSPEPARRFPIRVAETDLLVALDEEAPDEGAETLGSTVLFLLLADRLTRALHTSPDEDPIGAAVEAMREHIGPKCAELAHDAVGLLGSPEPQRSGAELDHELLPTLILLAAGFALRDCQNNPGLLRRHEPCWHDEDSTIS